MPRKRLEKGKMRPFSEFNSRDVLNFWYSVYSSVNKEDYSHGDFVGRELQYFRELLDSYDVYALLMAIERGILNGENLIRYFKTNVEKYIPDTDYPKYFFLIDRFAPQDLKNKLFELSVCETQWIPTAVTNKKITDISREFDDWLVLNSLS